MARGSASAGPFEAVLEKNGDVQVATSPSQKVALEFRGYRVREDVEEKPKPGKPSQS